MEDKAVDDFLVCCHKMRLHGNYTEACNKPAVTIIEWTTEMRRGWTITTRLPVCANHYQARTGKPWDVSAQLTLLDS